MRTHVPSMECRTCKQHTVTIEGIGWMCTNCNEGGNVTLFRDRGKSIRKLHGRPDLERHEQASS